MVRTNRTSLRMFIMTLLCCIIIIPSANVFAKAPDYVGSWIYTGGTSSCIQPASSGISNAYSYTDKFLLNADGTFTREIYQTGGAVSNGSTKQKGKYQIKVDKILLYQIKETFTPANAAKPSYSDKTIKDINYSFKQKGIDIIQIDNRKYDRIIKSVTVKDIGGVWTTDKAFADTILNGSEAFDYKTGTQKMLVLIPDKSDFAITGYQNDGIILKMYNIKGKFKLSNNKLIFSKCEMEYIYLGQSEEGIKLQDMELPVFYRGVDRILFSDTSMIRYSPGQ